MRTLHQHLGAIVSAALAAVDARRVTARAFESIADELRGDTRVRVVAAGKAAVGMAAAASEALGPRLLRGVMTAALDDTQTFDPRWNGFSGTHPVPNEASEAAGRAALELAAEAAGEGSRLVVCLSGGASSMLAVPATGLTIADKAAATEVLLRAGLGISQVNCVRRHLSAIKGGQLGATAKRVVTFAISDVCSPIEDDPSVIGSGPTVGDETSFEDALGIITSAGLIDELPAPVVTHLRAGAAGRREGPIAPSDLRLREGAFWVIASRHDAMQAAASTARQIGYHVRVLDFAAIGPAELAGPMLLDNVGKLSKPACVIATGETTVRVTGEGRGGRNQELAVAVLRRLAAVGPAALAAIGTDGIDGPTDAAGAFVDSSMWAALGPSASETRDAALARNDTYPLLDKLGALVRIGPTGTNVGDLHVLLCRDRAG